MAALDSHYIYSGGIRIRYVERGAGTPIVLVHGLTASVERNWINWGIFDALAADHRVVALDCRGHGASGKPHNPNCYANPTKCGLCLDVVRLVEKVVLGPAHVVGYSLGGRITARLAVDRPDIFLSATIAGADVFSTDVPTILEKHYRNNDRKAIDALRTAWKHLAVTESQLRELRIPVLGLCGTEDKHLPEYSRLLRSVRCFCFVSIDGAEHLTAPKNPGFLATLRWFLRSCDARLLTVVTTGSS